MVSGTLADFLACRFRKRYNFLFDEDFPAEKQVCPVFIFKRIDLKVFNKNKFILHYLAYAETSTNDQEIEGPKCH